MKNEQVALTLKQPWAGLVVLGKKTLENRSWRPSDRFKLPFRLLVHAGQGTDREWDGEWYPACKVRGIIGHVDVVGYIFPDFTVETELPSLNQSLARGKIPVKDAEWWNGQDIGWILRDAVSYGPERIVPVKGKLGLWTYSAPPKG